MNQENIFNNIIKHMTSDADCRICKMLNWEKDCPWKEEEAFENNDKRCKEYLGNRLSTNIKIENQKIETTEEGDKFFSTLFTTLENYEVR